MKKLVWTALCVGGMGLAVGCGSSSDGGPPTVLFDWGAGTDCPDLTVANREATVIIEGVDADGVAANEQFLYDCGDGVSPAEAIPDGDWDFELDVVDVYADNTDPINCFGSPINTDCLYYTAGSELVENVDTFVALDNDLIIDFNYGFGSFTIDYTIDGLDPSAAQCGNFDTGASVDGLGAADLAVAISFYGMDGLLEDVFACGAAAETRDLPLETYVPVFDLLDSGGNALGQTSALDGDGSATLSTHLQNIILAVDLVE